MKRSLFLFILLTLFPTLYSQTLSVDSKQLSGSLKQQITEHISEKITEAIRSGEKGVLKDNYIDIMLEPLEPLGVNPHDPDFINSAKGIYNEIKSELDKDPSLSASGLLKGKVSDLVKGSMINYAGSFIDDGSKEIYDQVSNLASSCADQIDNLLKATDAVGNLDVTDPDYQSAITATLKSYGLKSDYFYAINDLDLVLSKGWDKIKDPLQAIYMISEAADSNDPIEKIGILFEIGETFGGKVPIIGSLITPLFTLAKGVLDAAKGLENVLEKNLGQGCITNTGGYGYVNSGKKNSFTTKFSSVGRVCPINQKVFSPIYNNIYVEEGKEENLFFYLNKKWFRGKSDTFHKGGADIRATIQWLRRNGHSDKVNDLSFVFNAYQKEYGWLAYEKQVRERIEKMISLFVSSYQFIGFCNDTYTRDFFMAQIGFNWLTSLMQPTDNDFGWDELKMINYGWEKPLVNMMVFNYFLSRHKDNLNNLDRIITNLETYVPVNIYGKVTDEDGVPLQGAMLQADNAMFQVGDGCRKTTTGADGSFSYYLLFSMGNGENSKVRITVSANSKVSDRVVLSQDLTIIPSITRSYHVNLISPASKDRVPHYTATSDSSYADDEIAVMLSNAPCADDPNAIAEWNEDKQSVDCFCIDNYVWDPSQQKCIKDIQTILDNSDCSEYLNTEPKWDNDTNEPYCDCIDGYVWDEDNYENGCISKEQQLLAQTDCSQYGSAHAVIDPVTNEITCDCIPGYVWNNDGTRCISENLIAMQNMDCSQIPNTEPAWDDVSNEPYCDCKPGYEWNEDYTACEKIMSQNPNDYACSTPNTVPIWDNVLQQMVCDCRAGYMWNQSQTACIHIKRKPSVDWNNVLNVTMGVLSTINSNNNFVPPSGNTTGNTGGNNQQPVVSRNNCNDKVEHGGDAPEVHIIDLGQAFGSFVLDYEMHSIKDQIIVSQGGRVLYDSKCVSGSNSVRINIGGFNREIQVKVNPNCDGTNGTAWDFTVHCPDQ